MNSRNKSFLKRIQQISQLTTTTTTTTTTTKRNYEIKRQRIFENFTRRKFSRFEYIEIIDFISNVQIFSN